MPTEDVREAILRDASAICRGAARTREAAWRLARQARASRQRREDTQASRTAARVSRHVQDAISAWQRGATSEAIEGIRAALALDPRDLAACRTLVDILDSGGQAGDAADAWFCRGVALEHRDRVDEAIAAYREALYCKPDGLWARFGLGALLLKTGAWPDAMACFEDVLRLDPNHAAAHLNLGSAYQLTGQLERGWNHFAWYQRHGDQPRRYLAEPLWEGPPLNGRTILLWQDQRLGDTVHLVRYVELVSERGGRPLVECAGPLASLIARMRPVERVIVKGTPLPAFATHAPLSALPRIFETRLSSMPRRVPYLRPAPPLVARWRRRLQRTGERAGRTVGLVWGSGPVPRGRSVPLADCAPLADVRDVRFISLQLGPPQAELVDPPAGLRLEQLPCDPGSVEDTAAVMMNLDLVITVDTMAAHLAGALGKPVWTLLSHAPAWLWMPDGDRSPWYPTMRVYRQRRPGDWGDVMMRVAADLR